MGHAIYLILCHPLVLWPLIISSIRVFSTESTLPIRWPKYWSISFSNSPSNVYSGLISVSIDWLDLLAIQGTLKSLLQHHNVKVPILWHSSFFIVKLSHQYRTTGKKKKNNKKHSFDYTQVCWQSDCGESKLSKMAWSGSLTTHFVNNDCVTAEIT